jgi:hypothetical protein
VAYPSRKKMQGEGRGTRPVSETKQHAPLLSPKRTRKSDRVPDRAAWKSQRANGRQTGRALRRRKRNPIVKQPVAFRPHGLFVISSWPP